MQQDSLASAILRRRKSLLLLIVGAAIWLNVWYLSVDGSELGHSTFVRRSAAKPRVELPSDTQTAFLYKATNSNMADTCHTERDAEFEGEEVIKWGTQFLVDSPDACCDACKAAPGCNVWVYCARGEGTCPDGRQPKECWLKKKAELNPVHPQGRRVPGCGWVSGALFDEIFLLEAAHKKKKEDLAFKKYLRALHANETLPMVHMDITIRGWPKGRIEIVLFPDVAPRAAENFRRLCTGELGIVPQGREGAGKPYHFRGAYFYRIIDQFINQAGIYTESALGGMFKDDPGGLALKHDRKGILSMANAGPNTNTAHFSIMMGPAHHLDGHYTIFGQVVTGFDVVDAINVLSVGKKDNTAGVEEEVLIAESGEQRKGTIMPNLEL